ncbi:MAG: hypothetical protein AAGG02_17780 [Cyanobacteria bacterium P01_H01_bin.15]
MASRHRNVSGRHRRSVDTHKSHIDPKILARRLRSLSVQTASQPVPSFPEPLSSSEAAIMLERIERLDQSVQNLTLSEASTSQQISSQTQTLQAFIKPRMPEDTMSDFELKARLGKLEQGLNLVQGLGLAILMAWIVSMFLFQYWRLVFN